MVKSTPDVSNLHAPFERLKVENQDSPSVALAKAIILQAAIDYCTISRTKEQKTHEQDAQKWIFNHFENTCKTIGLTLDYIKNLCAKLQELKLKNAFVHQTILDYSCTPKSMRQQNLQRNASILILLR